MRRHNVPCVPIGFLMLLFFQAQVHPADAENALLLGCKPKENVTYLVELTLRRVNRHKDMEPERLHERAVIRYGEAQAEGEGESRVRPEMIILTLESNMKRPHYWGLRTMPPLAKKYPSGRPTRFVDGNASPGRPWHIDWIYRTFDFFPMFPNTPVTPGGKWQTRMDMAFLGSSRYISPVRTEYRLTGLERIEERSCAVIQYTFWGVFKAAKHPEMLQTEFARQRMPEYTLSGKGTVYFDTEAGIIFTKEQQSELTIKRTRKADPEFAKQYPQWAGQAEIVSRYQLSARLICEDEASRLIKEAEEARAKAPKPLEELPEVGPSWKYLVERTITRRELGYKSEKSYVDRAYVHYGAGAKQAGGQIGTAPQVVYVDTQGKRLAKPVVHGPAFTPFDQKKLSLTAELPEFGGPGSGLPLPLAVIATCFDILPTQPHVPLKQGATWSSTIDTFFGYPHAETFRFPATIKCHIERYEKRKARDCAKITYTITGEFKSSEHPERFTEEDLREWRYHLALEGEGVAYFDPEAGVIVEKEQTISWTTSAEKLRLTEDGNEHWVPNVDERTSVTICVSLQGN